MMLRLPEDLMTDNANANDVVAFLVEMGTLVFLGLWAWRLGEVKWSRGVTVVVVVGAAVILWGLFASPRATFDVPVAEVAVKVMVLGGGILAAFAAISSVPIAVAWGAVVVVNTILIYVGPFART
ncbi:YrdB family protein [Williamsia sterculiae]|uniref:DUF2568 domain-containing protein n=1 Tax=Williamsia sterculiae TaxID=1344003 RepID=A0A1N7H444_9NOCA|nr:YrdB family protein [Williamsia sterculiae]SIS19458.1 Protein of unknown function [Williamsia sterculiae]